ncbi:antA/AntB antirepressor family protein [Vibrio vulnificus]|uniref:antA/AntB antirepressor family protein n=1 Tax=Vibrio vulnificus TaxID=672 RepID=UPI001593102E|nr:antA/AntB antirepressor family protein [Vibrio vulnificus]NVC72616.1 hypothetical protein [Vibrio vulnificus]
MTTTIKTLSNISKKELQTICQFTLEEAKAIHRYRKKVPVITDAEIHEASVDARTLHGQLCIKTKFADWIKRRVIERRFIQGIDYEVFLNSENNSKGGAPSLEYLLTVDTAKQLAMAEDNEVGDTVRRYFLLTEKALKGIYAYNPSRIMTLKNKEKLNEIYNNQFKHMKPEEFFSITNATVSLVSTGVKPYRWKQAKMPTPAKYLEGSDLSFYLSVQDTYLRALEGGMSLNESKDLIEMLYKDGGEGIFEKYVGDK